MPGSEKHTPGGWSGEYSDDDRWGTSLQDSAANAGHGPNAINNNGGAEENPYQDTIDYIQSQDPAV